MKSSALFLLVGSSLHCQSITPTVQAGSISCTTVMRGINQVQTYCYAPGSKLVHNTINEIYNQLIVTFDWCVSGAMGCTSGIVTWAFKVNPNFTINWQATTNINNVIQSGLLTKVYGSSVNCINVPTNRIYVDPATGFKGLITFWTREDEVCSSWVTAQNTWNSYCGYLSCAR